MRKKYQLQFMSALEDCSTSAAASSSSSCLLILNNTLAESELNRLFKLQQLKIKVSNSTLPHTCLYPQSSVAFMVLPTSSILTSWPPTNRSTLLPQVTENLEKFSHLHHRCYVLVTSPLIGAHEQAVLGLLQERFLTADVEFLPTHNSKECVECMQTIARLASKPLASLVRSRMDEMESQLVSEESVAAILSSACGGGGGLTPRECVMLMDGCGRGGLAGLAHASREELVDLNLDEKTIKHITNLFGIQ